MKTDRSLRSINSQLKQKHSNSPTYHRHYVVSKAVAQKKASGVKSIKTSPVLRNLKEDSLDINSNLVIFQTKRKTPLELLSKKKKYKFYKRRKKCYHTLLS